LPIKKAMKDSRPYAIDDPDGIYFVTFATVYWIDVFTRKRYKDMIVESLKFCQEKKGLELFAWCLMTNHIHLIIRAKEGFNLSDILRDFKKFTASQIIGQIALGVTAIYAMADTHKWWYGDGTINTMTTGRYVFKMGVTGLGFVPHLGVKVAVFGITLLEHYKGDDIERAIRTPTTQAERDTYNNGLKIYRGW
jgi:REP element-mobilizing transposase RayT